MIDQATPIASVYTKGCTIHAPLPDVLFVNQIHVGILSLVRSWAARDLPSLLPDTVSWELVELIERCDSLWQNGRRSSAFPLVEVEFCSYAARNMLRWMHMTGRDLGRRGIQLFIPFPGEHPPVLFCDHTLCRSPLFYFSGIWRQVSPLLARSAGRSWHRTPTTWLNPCSIFSGKNLKRTTAPGSPSS